jgi:hypothetical protein
LIAVDTQRRNGGRRKARRLGAFVSYSSIAALAHLLSIHLMKKIGFLSFGHWTPSSQSQVRSASDALRQSIDLAVAAEEFGR